MEERRRGRDESDRIQTSYFLLNTEMNEGGFITEIQKEVEHSLRLKSERIRSLSIFKGR